MDGLAAVQGGTQTPKAKDLTAEMVKLTKALGTIDEAVATIRAAIRDIEKVDIPGVDVKANLATKLAALLAEHQIKPAKKARAARA